MNCAVGPLIRTAGRASIRHPSAESADGTVEGAARWPNTNSTSPTAFSTPYAADERSTTFLRSVYGWMFAGLGITAAVAYFVAQSPTLAIAIAKKPGCYWGCSSRAKRGQEPGGGDPPGVRPALPSHHDDHDGGAPRRAAAGARDGRRIGAAPTARDRHRRRADREPGRSRSTRPRSCTSTSIACGSGGRGDMGASCARRGRCAEP